MTDSIAISVVIPCFNSAPWLQETVKSVWRQSRQDFEIILVDDGSTDTTPSVIESLIDQSRGHPIKNVRQENQGLAAARNRGISLAAGRYILPLDADDLLHPSALADCAGVLDIHPEIDLVYGDRQDFGDCSGRWRPGHFEVDRLKYFNQLPYCGLFRYRLWEKLGGYKSNVNGFDDWDFWLAAALSGARAHYLPEAYLRHRRHRQSQLWRLLDAYETLYARIILNNPGAFGPTERACAESWLQDRTPAALLSGSRFVFMQRYYSAYPPEASCAS